MSIPPNSIFMRIILPVEGSDVVGSGVVASGVVTPGVVAAGVVVSEKLQMIFNFPYPRYICVKFAPKNYLLIYPLEYN